MINTKELKQEKIMNKKWEVCQEDEEKIAKLAEQNNLSHLLASILINRNIDTNEKVEQFISPTRSDFHDPFLMPDMEKAVERILKAIQIKEMFYSQKNNKIILLI